MYISQTIVLIRKLRTMFKMKMVKKSWKKEMRLIHPNGVSSNFKSTLSRMVMIGTKLKQRSKM